jgi:hypothetical protein
LPDEFQAVPAMIAVVVSDLGSEAHAYGQYFGDGIASERNGDAPANHGPISSPISSS